MRTLTLLFLLLLLWTFPLNAQDEPTISDLAWRPDGMVLALGVENQGVLLLDPEFHVMGHIETAAGWQTPTWSHDGRRLVIVTCEPYCGHGDGVCTPQMWTIADDGTGGQLQWSEPLCAYVLQWSPSDRWMSFWNSRSEFILAESQDAASMRTFPGNIRASEWHPAQDWLAFADEANTVRVFEPARNVYLWSHSNPETSEQHNFDIAWSTDGNQLAMIISSGQKTISAVNEAGPYSFSWPVIHGIDVWDLQNNSIEPVIRINNDATIIRAIWWLSPNLIAGLSRTRNEVTSPDWLGIWDTASGERITDFYIAGGGSASGCCVSWSPDYKHFAALVQWRIFSTTIFDVDEPPNGSTLYFGGAVWSPDSHFVTTRHSSFLWHMDVQTKSVAEYELFYENGAFEIHVAEPGASDHLFLT